MNKKDWIIVIILMIVIGVGASLLTTKMTGNVIKVPTTVSTTQADVYTKAEVDAILGNFTTVTISSTDKTYASSNYTCSQICNSWTRTKNDRQFSTTQRCLWMGISGEEKNEYNATTPDTRMFDGNACNMPIRVYLTQGWKYITCFCG